MALESLDIVLNCDPSLPARQKRDYLLSVSYYIFEVTFLPNLPKLLSTKQTDTVENVTVAP